MLADDYPKHKPFLGYSDIAKMFDHCDIVDNHVRKSVLRLIPIYEKQYTRQSDYIVSVLRNVINTLNVGSEIVYEEFLLFSAIMFKRSYQNDSDDPKYLYLDRREKELPYENAPRNTTAMWANIYAESFQEFDFERSEFRLKSSLAEFHSEVCGYLADRERFVSGL